MTDFFLLLFIYTESHDDMYPTNFWLICGFIFGWLVNRFGGGFASSGETRRVYEMKGEMGEVLKEFLCFFWREKK